MSYWLNKKALVTGAAGFVGSNLTRELLKRGAHVVLISQKATLSPTPILDKGLISSIGAIEKGSIDDFVFLKKIFKKHSDATVFHLAAQSIVEIGKVSPLQTFEVNIKGTWNMLEASRMYSARKVIIASTSHVYGNNKILPYLEEYFPQPSRPYETSKACADLLAQSYADTYHLPVEIPRFC